MLVRPLYQIDQFDRLQKEVLDIISKISFDKNQIICQSLESEPNNWHVGVGRIEELVEQEEKLYTRIHDSLEGTFLKELILQHNAYRTRIMLMPPRQCYSIHADPSKRIHIPIITNEQCWMIWPRNNSCYQLETRRAYLTDTTKAHTFVNGGTEDRIHIVMCV